MGTEDASSLFVASLEQAALTINDKAKRMIQATYLLETDMAQTYGARTFNWD